MPDEAATGPVVAQTAPVEPQNSIGPEPIPEPIIFHEPAPSFEDFLRSQLDDASPSQQFQITARKEGDKLQFAIQTAGKAGDLVDFAVTGDTVKNLTA